MTNRSREKLLTNNQIFFIRKVNYESSSSSCWLRTGRILPKRQKSTKMINSLCGIFARIFFIFAQILFLYMLWFTYFSCFLSIFWIICTLFWLSLFKTLIRIMDWQRVIFSLSLTTQVFLMFFKCWWQMSFIFKIFFLLWSLLIHRPLLRRKFRMNLLIIKLISWVHY